MKSKSLSVSLILTNANYSCSPLNILNAGFALL